MTNPPADSQTPNPPTRFPYLRWLLISPIWLLLALFFAAQSVYLGGFNWSSAIKFSLFDWTPWILLAPIVFVISSWIRQRHIHIVWTSLIHLILAIVFSLLIEMLTWIQAINPGPPRPNVSETNESRHFSSFERNPRFQEFESDKSQGQQSFPEREFHRPQRPQRSSGFLSHPGGGLRARFAFPVYFVLLAASQTLAQHRKSLERERKMLHAQSLLTEARLTALQTQLQPHFYFNALNSIAELIHSQPDIADQMICDLGQLMRGVLDVSERHTLPLEEELAFIDHYIRVQQLRFPERLKVKRDIHDNALPCQVPTLILQPLVENAINHGVSPSSTESTISISARVEDNRIHISVTNTCPLHSAAPPFDEGIGISNTRSRLQTLYGDDFTFEHRIVEPNSIAAEISFPFDIQNA